MKIEWTKEERYRIGVAVVEARNAGTNEAEAAAQAAVYLFLARASGQVKEDVALLGREVSEGGADYDEHLRALSRLSALAQEAATYRGMWETATRELGTLSSTLETVRRMRSETSAEAESIRAQMTSTQEALVAFQQSDRAALEQLAHALGWTDGGPGWKAAMDAIGELRAKVAELEAGAQLQNEHMRQRDAALAEAERLKAERETMQRRGEGMKEAISSLNVRVSSAESRLAAIRLCIREHDTEDGPDFVQTVNDVRRALEGDAAQEATYLDVELVCGRCATWVPHRWMPSPDAGPGWRCSQCSTLSTDSRRPQEAPITAAGMLFLGVAGPKTAAPKEVVPACVCRLGHDLPCYAKHHPCSPTCTHDDAATPGHPERVRAQSGAMVRAALGVPAEEESAAVQLVRLAAEAGLPVRFVPRADDDTAAAASDAYDRGAEAMRTACWEAVQKALEPTFPRSGWTLLWDDLKTAIEGAVP